jgi:rubrerythrin
MRPSAELVEWKKKTTDRKKAPRKVDKAAAKTFEGYVKKNLEKLSDDQKIEFLLDGMPYIQEYVKDSEGACDVVETKKPAVGRRGGVSSMVEDVVDRSAKTILARFKCDVGDGDEDDYMETLQSSIRENKDRLYACENCGGYLVNVGHEMVCDACGHVREDAGDVDRPFAPTPSDYERSTIETRFHYKRSNHFGEWLASLQGNENTEIDQSVIDRVRDEFVKARMTNPDDVTQLRVRGYLKKLGLNKLYEHSYQICRELGGQSAKLIPPDLERKLKTMFAQIQGPFEICKPPERKNFLSYSYVLYQLMRLLGEVDYLQYLPLLKSSEKLFKHDKTWKEMCKLLDWRFEPTV